MGQGTRTLVVVLGDQLDPQSAAVLKDWPAWIVPIDIAWGIALTAVAALAGKLAQRAVGGQPAGRGTPP